jgi:excisionase family DNA binding protein
MSDSWLSDLRTTTQIAELLQMKRSTVEDYARRGLLPSIKLGRHRRFIHSDVEAALAQLRNGSRRQELRHIFGTPSRYR